MRFRKNKKNLNVLKIADTTLESVRVLFDEKKKQKMDVVDIKTKELV